MGGMKWHEVATEWLSKRGGTPRRKLWCHPVPEGLWWHGPAPCGHAWWRFVLRGDCGGTLCPGERGDILHLADRCATPCLVHEEPCRELTCACCAQMSLCPSCQLWLCPASCGSLFCQL